MTEEMSDITQPPKRRRGRPRKTDAPEGETPKAAAPAKDAVDAAAPAAEGAAEAPKRRRGRPRKVAAEGDVAPQVAEAKTKAGDDATNLADAKPKRSRAKGEDDDQPDEPKPKRTRAKRVAKADANAVRPERAEGEAPKATEGTAAPREREEASAPRERKRPGRGFNQQAAGEQEPRRERAEQPAFAEGKERGERQERPARTERQDRQEREGRSERQEREGRPERAERNDRGDRPERRSYQANQGYQRNQGGYQQRDRQGQRFQKYQDRRGKNGRHNNANGYVEPSLSREYLTSMRVAELRSHAAGLGVEYLGVTKDVLVETIYVTAARAEGFRPAAGVLEIVSEGYGFVRTGNYMAGEDDAFVPQQLIKQLGLRPGDWVEGTVRPSRPNDKYPALQRVASVNGQAPENLKARPRFRDLTPVYPNERLVMEHGRDSITGRCVDLVAPIGKGQRGLIVSPPKAGKTTVLKRICESIAVNNPEVHLICLLVDERPEEVTDMQRSIKGDVVASTFDMPADNHTAVSELVIERAKRLVELGRDVVVVLDSITRLARAYNIAQPASGRILSGGVDSAALYPPKKFLGAARNIENGGSLTILASALVETGSKMDEVIFEEFKGTGNMELKLDRDLADRRIFPAIDPVQSGTRNEELLVEPELQPLVWGIRRVLANMNNPERAQRSLIKGLRDTDDNRDFLIRSAKKAQQSDYSDPL